MEWPREGFQKHKRGKTFTYGYAHTEYTSLSTVLIAWDQLNGGHHARCACRGATSSKRTEEIN
jgi:hypothetical protein